MSGDPEWEAVFFDIGGVILDHESVRRGHERFIELLAEEFDLEYEAALETWREVLGTYFREREGTTYRPARVGYGLTVDELVGGEVPEDDWLPLFERATEECLRPIEGAPETVRALDEAGLYLGVVSDIDTWEAERLLGMFGVLDRFDDLTTSEAVGRTKPDPAMFETAIRKADVDPARSLMVGDRYRHDMQGGKTAGLTTVAHGGSAAEEAPDAERFAVDDPAVDYVVCDIRDLLRVVGVDGSAG